MRSDWNAFRAADTVLQPLSDSKDWATLGCLNGFVTVAGSVSHHHGVGKRRKQWYEQMVSTTGQNMLRAIKEEIDPKNIFGASNLMDVLPRPSKL